MSAIAVELERQLADALLLNAEDARLLRKLGGRGLTPGQERIWSTRREIVLVVSHWANGGCSDEELLTTLRAYSDQAKAAMRDRLREMA